MLYVVNYMQIYHLINKWLYSDHHRKIQVKLSKNKEK